MKDFHVVYEDNHIIVVNKRAGILVQGDSTGDRTLTDAVKDYIKRNITNLVMFFFIPFIV